MRVHSCERTMTDASEMREAFGGLYGGEALVYRAPGRVNLIGEHTDYNEGFVMPAAIDFYTWVAIAPRSDSKVNIRSQSFEDNLSIDLDGDLRPRHAWSDYVVGVLEQIKHEGNAVSGADILIHGEVPIG